MVLSEVAAFAPHDGVRWRIVSNVVCGVSGFVAQMPGGDSSCESIVVAGPYEQTDPAEL
jgi:hypothetical protein